MARTCSVCPLMTQLRRRTQSHEPTISAFALPRPSFASHKKWVVVAFDLNGIRATQGNSIVALYLPAASVSVNASDV